MMTREGLAMNIAAIHKKKIAVIGSGISGLSCAWLLNQVHDVTLFEKDDRLGGHSNTVRINDSLGRDVDVDTGFIVYNPVNYPNLVRFFEHIGISSEATDMSFAVSLNQGGLEYSGCGLAGLFAQRRNLIRPGFWQLLNDTRRFYREASRYSREPEFALLSLGELLQQEGYSQSFIYQHLVPMGAAIWSTPVQQMLNYPAQTFLRFCQNHGLVQLKARPEWRTLRGGSKTYVDKIAATLGERIRLNSHIHRIERHPEGIWLEDRYGKRQHFDQVVLACHADQALALLASPSDREQALLSCFPYQRNRAILHRDPRLMPQRRAAWASWNYLGEMNNARPAVSVTYWMNRLQPLATDEDLFVSLNPLEEPTAGTIERSFLYDHPAFDLDSISAQHQLWQLQGQHNTWYCGAYFGYGFHEDGLQAGLAVAEALGGIPRPWQLENPNSRIHVQALPPQRVHKEASYG